MTTEDIRLVAHALIALATLVTAWRGSRGRRDYLRRELHEIRGDIMDLRDDVSELRARVGRAERPAVVPVHLYTNGSDN